MTTNSTAWRVPLWAYVPVGLAITAEAVSNALRAYGLGAALERFTIHVPAGSIGTSHALDVSLSGAVLVLAAIAVSLSQARAAWVALTPLAPARQRVVSGLAAALLLAISVTAMSSHILEAQRAREAGEGGERARYDRAEAAYKRAAAELATLSGVRSTADVRAAMDAAPVSRAVFARTTQCTDVTIDASRLACQPILDLRVEMGRAIRKADLERDTAALRAELAAIARPASASEREDTIAHLWAWIMGLGVVLVATFGSVIFARVQRSDRPSDSDSAQTSLASDDPARLAAFLNPDDPALRSSERSEGVNRQRPNDDDPVPPVPPGGPRKRRTDGRTAKVLSFPAQHRTDGQSRSDRPSVCEDVNRQRQDKVLAFLMTELAAGRTVGQSELIGQFGVARSTLSDWLSDWEADGLIPTRRTVGRTKVVG